MKIITWNCNGAFRKKHHALEDQNADLLIIQECENPSQSTKRYNEWAGDYLWFGENKHKGIGVFSRNGTMIKKLDWKDSGLQMFLPCRVNDSFNLIAVWTKYANSPNFRYIGQFWQYLQQHKEKIKKENTVICGDFNSNVIWDEWDRWWNHSDVVRELSEISINSIYHKLHSEKQGQETKPTLFMHRKKEKPYHIDYAFAPNNMFGKDKTSLNVGEPKIWLEYSDHMPITFKVIY